MRKTLFYTLLALLILVGGFFAIAPPVADKLINKVHEHAPFPVSEEATALHQSLIVGDWHADSTLWNRDLEQYNTRGHVDIPRLQEGNVAFQMFTIVTKSPSGLNYDKNDAESSDDITRLAYVQRWPSSTWNNLTERALYQADKLHQLATDSDQFSLVTSQATLQAFMAAKATRPQLVAGLIGIEGGHALEGKLDNIDALYNKGVRMVGLQHFFDNRLGGSLHGISQQGLTEFGAQAVIKMEQMNIIIDVSHSSEATVKDVLALANRPVVVSHTGFKGHCDTNRNIADELMVEIANRGGIIAIGYWDAAVCGSTPADVADAIIYGIQLVGEDHLSLGSDYDGAIATSFDTSELAALTHALLAKGVSETAIRKVMGENMLRFLQQNLPPQ